MFPAPRQRWVDAMASREADIRALPHETLVMHGREDQVIPLSTSLTLAEWIQNAAQLHVFGQLRPLDADRTRARFNPTGRRLPRRSRSTISLTFPRGLPWKQSKIEHYGDELYNALITRTRPWPADRPRSPTSPSRTPTRSSSA
jgi:hypothetical protein